MIIHLAATIESQLAPAVQYAINSPDQQRKVESLYLSGRDYIVDLVKSKPHLFTKDIVEFITSGRLSEATEQSCNDGSFMDNMKYVFEMMCVEMFGHNQLRALVGPSKTVITTPYIPFKLDWVDYTIGVTVKPNDDDIIHLQEHEGIEASVAAKMLHTHNQWMRDNANTFDFFFDEHTPQQVIDFIKTL